MSREIPLKSKKYPGLSAMIDNMDYKLIKKYKWRPLKTTTKYKDKYYAYADTYINGKKTTISMHRLIMGSPKRPFVVDHINRDGLDNRRSNLRVVTHAENRINAEGIDSSSLDPSVKTAKIKFPIELYNSIWILALDENITIPNIILDALYYYFTNKHPQFLSRGKIEGICDLNIHNMDKAQAKLDLFE